MLYARHDESHRTLNTFVLHLQSATQYERIADVASFVAEDDSGSFGILAGHARAITCLTLGLARFRTADGAWRFLAVPGGVLYFVDNQLYVNTRHYFHDSDASRIGSVLREELLAEEEKLHGIKESLQRLEEAMLKRMWTMQREWRSLA
jgi:F-type H+-transporting ATPase subunit epsilon